MWRRNYELDHKCRVRVAEGCRASNRADRKGFSPTPRSIPLDHATAQGGPGTVTSIPVPVGVRLRATATATTREAARAIEALDDTATGFVVLGTSSSGLEASVLANFVAHRTSGIGLVVEAAAQRDHPYNIARRTASLDHLSGGRAGWWVLPHDPATELGLGLRSSWVDSPPTDRTLDAVIAVRALWRTWPVDTIIGDIASNIFTRAEDIRHADHDGIFTTAGPLTVPTTPQGEPVIFGPEGSDLTTGAPDSFVSVGIDGIEEALDAGATGLVVDVDDVDAWAREVLPSLITRGIVYARQRVSTLRQYLDAEVPAEPDLSARRPAFT